MVTRRMTSCSAWLNYAENTNPEMIKYKLYMYVREAVDKYVCWLIYNVQNDVQNVLLIFAFHNSDVTWASWHL